MCVTNADVKRPRCKRWRDGDFIVPFNYEDNSTKIIKGFINDFNSPENTDFNFDLYYFTVYEKESLKWFIMAQDYQNPTKLESIKKAMREH